MVAKTTRSYKTKNTKPTIRKIKLNDEIVSQYLNDNPDFFIRNASLIENMRIPHPIEVAFHFLNGKWQGSEIKFLILRQK